MYEETLVFKSITILKQQQIKSTVLLISLYAELNTY